MTPYQALQFNIRALEADRNSVLDPGVGTVKVGQSPALLVVNATAGDRTLEAATNLPLQTTILCIATIASVTVNTVSVPDGGWVEFHVTLSASGVKEWTVKNSSAEFALAATTVTRAVAAASAGLVPVSGGADRSIGVATPAALGTVDINTGDASTDTALIALANALQAFGLVTHTWT